jgi:hypothetical protein
MTEEEWLAELSFQQRHLDGRISEPISATRGIGIWIPCSKNNIRAT